MMLRRGFFCGEIVFTIDGTGWTFIWWDFQNLCLCFKNGFQKNQLPFNNKKGDDSDRRMIVRWRYVEEIIGIQRTDGGKCNILQMYTDLRHVYKFTPVEKYAIVLGFLDLKGGEDPSSYLEHFKTQYIELNRPF